MCELSSPAPFGYLAGVPEEPSVEDEAERSDALIDAEGYVHYLKKRTVAGDLLVVVRKI